MEYRFVTDFGVPGRPVREDACEFEYKSAGLGGSGPGWTNSPLYNQSSQSHYPHNITCRYKFQAAPGELVRVRFTHFYVEDFFIEELANDKRHHSVGSFVPCAGDRVDLIERYRESGLVKETKVLTYCGNALPGPYATQFDSQELMLVFASTWDKMPHPIYGRRTATGFRLAFDFPRRPQHLQRLQLSQMSPPPPLPAPAAADDCGGDLSSDSHGGLVHLPSGPQSPRAAVDRVCEWRVRPRQPGGLVLVQFPEFHLEGSTKSCSKAVVRLYHGDNRVPASELCGSDNGIPAFNGRPGEHVRVRLVTTVGSLGGRGLKFAWTEVLMVDQRGDYCPGFRCKRSGHCIDHRLECNRQPNCGSVLINVTTVYNPEFKRWKNYSEYYNDNSDEEINCPTDSAYQLLHVGVGVIVTVLLLAAVVAFVLYREHRRAAAGKKQRRREAVGDENGDGAALAGSGATRQLMSERLAAESHVGRDVGGFATIRNGGHHGYSHTHSTSTLTREKMQKISIV